MADLSEAIQAPNPNGAWPYRMGTRQRMNILPTKDYSPLNLVDFVLPSTGYLNRLFLTVKGTIRRTAGDSSPGVDGLFANFLRRIQVEVNLGAGVIVDLSGAALNFMQWTLAPAFGATIAGSGSGSNAPTVTGPFVFPVPGAGTADYDFVYQWEIPIAANDGLNFETGLINLQANEIQGTLRIFCGTVADLFPVGAVIPGTSFVGVPTITPTMEWYEVPRPGTKIMVPKLILHRMLQDYKDLTSVGEFVYQPNRDGRLLQLMHLIVANNVLDNAGLSKGEIWLNQGNRIYEIGLNAWDFLWRRRYGTNPIAGVKLWDFWNAFQQPSQSDARDTFNLQAIATFESRLNILGPLGAAGTNRIVSIRRFTQPLQV